MALTGRQKAEVLISILRPEAMEKLYPFLPEEHVSILEKRAGNLPKPKPDDLMAVLKEIQSAAFLPREKKETPKVKEKIIPGMEGIIRTPSKVLSSRLLPERPQTIAFIVSYLPSEKAEDVVSYLPEKRKEVERLLKSIRRNSLSPQLKDLILDTLVKG